jgi:hypothetical protein
VARLQGAGTSTRKPKRVVGRGRIRSLEGAKKGQLLRRQSRAQQEPDSAGKVSNRRRLQSGKPRKYQLLDALPAYQATPGQSPARGRGPTRSVASRQFRPSVKLDTSQVDDRRGERGLDFVAKNGIRDLANWFRDRDAVSAIRSKLEPSQAEKDRMRRKILGKKRVTEFSRVARGTYKKHPKRGGK